MKKVRFCILGTNFISDNFVDAAKRLDNVEVAAIYSRKFDTGADFAKKHSIDKVFTDYRKVLACDNIDAVYVATPTFLHCEHTVLALNAGKHVLCEKSIASDYEEFIKMKTAADRSGCVFLEAMRTAFDPALDLIRQNISKIGRIRRASFEFCKYSSRYDKFKRGIIENAFNPIIKNSSLSDLGVYPLWLMVALFGEPLRIVRDSVSLSNGFEGAGALLLGYDNMIATVTYSKITDGFLPSVIEGEEGSILIDKISEPSRITLNLRGKTPKTLDYHRESNNMVYEIKAFAEMIDGRISAQPYIKITESVIRLMTQIQT